MTPGAGVMPATTSSASAMFGTSFGLTNETIWIVFRPVPLSALMNSILRAVGIGFFLDLKALARAFFLDLDALGKIWHFSSYWPDWQV